ncbi:MAG: hypothetical protein UY56_C0004G0003 [Parcubacteria group bacterium GW2011_GWA1_50_14]|nr:MAG: hypothetical protein UY56_C0004G0003 [Parcubacteria group bacterium GW2011_GWA1_50_14]
MINPETKTCQNCKNPFVIEPDDFQFYEKIKVPPPTWCTECREIRRIAFRNERALYRRKCDLCGKMVVARVSPDKPYPMYCQECWWSDKWDPKSYGKEYDFSRPFFEQLEELLLSVPHVALLNSNTVNSEWVNQETDVKNCYLEVGGHFNEDSAYNTYLFYSRDSFDNHWALRCELCYECVNCERCYQTLFSQECFDCRNVVFSYDCRNCMNVFGCAGLRNKQYYIWNKPCSKEEYEKFIEENQIASSHRLAELREKAQGIWLSVPRRDRSVFKSTNVSGNHIMESRNSENVWDAEKVENVKNAYLAIGVKESRDGSSFGWGEFLYEGAHGGGLYSSKFFAYIFGGGSRVDAVNSSFIEYCYTTPSCNSCFGCVNTRKEEYCILNKKYSKEDYEKLVPKIKEHMMAMPYEGKNGRMYRYGEFFPIEFSPFGYNESTAQDYYPLTREEALTRGYQWSDYESGTKYEFSDYEIPDDIKDVKDEILEKVLKCEVSGKAYKMIPMELQFYRRIGIPIPRRAPLERHKDRIARLLPRKIFDRMCQCAGKKAEGGRYENTVSHFHGDSHCPNAIETPYSPERPEIVYCETCYQAEII